MKDWTPEIILIVLMISFWYSSYLLLYMTLPTEDTDNDQKE